MRLLLIKAFEVIFFSGRPKWLISIMAVWGLSSDTVSFDIGVDRCLNITCIPLNPDYFDVYSGILYL